MSGFSRVPGWGGVEDGRAHVLRTHGFFLQPAGDVPGQTLPVQSLSAKAFTAAYVVGVNSMATPFMQ